MIEVIGFEEAHGRACAVYLVTDYTSGKRKPYRSIGRAVRVADGWWLPIGRVPAERWFEEGMRAIQRAYGMAVAGGLARFIRGTAL